MNYTLKLGMPNLRLPQRLILIMKLTTFILIASLIQVSAAGFAQKITLHEKGTSLKNVFLKLRGQTGYDFICDSKVIEGKEVTINLQNVDLEEALDAVFKSQDLDYSIKDKFVLVTNKVPSVMEKLRDMVRSAITVNAITGTVTDSLGLPLSGASVIMKGKKTYQMLTDNYGSFQFANVMGGEYKLSVTYIGYNKLEKIIQAGEVIEDLRLVLHQATSKLDQVQVIAYGKNTKRFSVGSVATVTAEEIEKQPVTNVLLALQGQVPGLAITPSNGAPGSAVQVQIRGQNSLSVTPGLTQYDQPMFIIDGVPFAPKNENINHLSSFGGGYPYAKYSGMSPFNSINPADIESITFLKDADATSIYGTQGAKGVVLITTKKGKSGDLNLDLTANTGVNIPTRAVEMMNTQQYLTMRREALANDGISLATASPSNYPDLLLFDQNKYIDWFKAYTGKSSRNTDVHASVSGGSPHTNFIVSTGATHASYNFPGDFADNRFTLHTGFHHSTLSNRVSIDFGTDYGYDHNRSAAQPTLGSAISLPPNLPDMIDATGNLVWNYKGADLSGYQKNGFLQQPSNLQTYNLNNSLRVAYRILTGLNFTTNIGYSRYTTTEAQAFPKASQSPDEAVSYASFANGVLQSINIEPQLDYSRTFGKGVFTALIGGTYKKSTGSSTQQNGYDYADDASLGSISSASSITASDASSIYRYVGVYGRLGYLYDQKYILSITGRRDGSSNFGPGRQFGNFGSLGLGWIFSAEDAFKSALPFISYGKLSGNYGTSGSDGVAPYQYQAFWQPTSNANPFQGIRPYNPGNLYNPDYSWDLKKSLNIAFDLGFLNDNLLMNVTWYQNRTGNQLTNYTLPSQSGFNAVLQNFDATVQNRGWEVTLTANPIHKKDIKWSANFNVSANRNKLLAFPGLESSSYASYYAVGKSTSVIYGFKYKGVNPTTGVFEFYKADGTVTSSPNDVPLAMGGDRQEILDPKPTIGGLGNTITYKGLSLYFFFQFAKQDGLNYLGNIYSNSSPGGMVNQPVELLDRWQKPGDLANIQRLTSGYSAASTAAYYFTRSSGAYSDASYIRLKTVSLSYGLPSSFIKKLGIGSCRFYVNAQNLLTITGYKVGDPEQPAGLFLFPLQRTIVSGLSFNL